MNPTQFTGVYGRRPLTKISKKFINTYSGNGIPACADKSEIGNYDVKKSKPMFLYATGEHRQALKNAGSEYALYQVQKSLSEHYFNLNPPY